MKTSHLQFWANFDPASVDIQKAAKLGAQIQKRFLENKRQYVLGGKKICGECGQLLPMKRFAYAGCRTPDGRLGTCKDCIYRRQYGQTRPARLRDKDK